MRPASGFSPVGRAWLDPASTTTDAWAVASDDPGYTWTVVNDAAAAEIDAIVRQPHHQRRLDYILIGSWHAHPASRAQIRTARLVADRPEDGIWASDPFGVCADLEIELDQYQTDQHQ